MAYKAKPPALATPTVCGIDLVGAVIPSTNSPSPHDLQDIAAAVIADRFRLSPCIAGLVCELAHIGGRFA
ncbi:hypothetical protein AB395_00001364 [Sinorhizobium fredii CCBAU 45436]|nr:hypothetical protein AB395_00001364 [Sinorhizobium fredii CCBAU 45436]